LLPGQQVCGERGRSYRILEWVGEGSYSRVYRAEGPGGLVALKLAKEEVAGAEERLLREKLAHTVLKHPAIPCYVDAGTAVSADDGEPRSLWLATEWVAGETLYRRLEARRALPLIQAVPMLLRIADALAAIHEAGWSHGDVRPHNVLIEIGSQHAFLLDLGEAQPFSDVAERAPDSRAGGRTSLSRAIRLRPVSSSTSSGAERPAPESLASMPSLDQDLAQLGALLAWALTAIDPHVNPDHLSLATGYHPTAVRLWQDTRFGVLTSAADFRDRLERLARELGLAMARRRR